MLLLLLLLQQLLGHCCAPEGVLSIVCLLQEGITGNSKWKEVKELMQDEEEWNELSKIDQLGVFEQYVRCVQLQLLLCGRS